MGSPRSREGEGEGEPAALLSDALEASTRRTSVARRVALLALAWRVGFGLG